MKKILFVIVCVLISCTLNAQEKHMQFKGTPLNGTLTSFVQKMKAKGYKTLLTQDHAVVMEGEFIGEDAKLYILSTRKTNIVWKVAVIFDPEVSWYSLKSDYHKIKESYTKKYGIPLHSFEKFYEPYYEGDGYELQALRKEKCSYSSYYKTPEGMISIEINSDGSIAICYEDEINSNINTKEKENAVMNEI